MKQCSICKIIKNNNEFAFQNKKVKKIMSACKECSNKKQREKRKNNLLAIRKRDKEQYQKHKEKRIKAAREYRKKYPDRTKNTNLKVKYGISIDDYYRMFKDQHGKCAICGIHQDKINKPLCVDHCHNTNKIRGLLCDNCNKFLGFYEKLHGKCKKYLEVNG